MTYRIEIPDHYPPPPPPTPIHRQEALNYLAGMTARIRARLGLNTTHHATGETQ